MTGGRGVTQHARRTGVVADDGVGEAVVVEVADGESAADFEGRERGAGGVAEDLLEAERRGGRTARRAVATHHAAHQLIALPERVGRAAKRGNQVHRAIDQDQVAHAVVVGVEPLGAEAGHHRGGLRQARLRTLVFEAAGAVVAIEHERLAHQVADDDVFVAVGVGIGGGDAHAAFGTSRGVERRAGQEALVFERAVALIAPQLARRRVVGDEHVEMPVAVEVADGDTEARAVRPQDARGLRHVLERAVALVAEQAVGHRTIRRRRAVVTRAGRLDAGLVGRPREVHVVGDEQIQVTVAVQIGKRGARAPARVVHAGAVGHVFERAVPGVAPQRVGAEAGDVQVDEPVAVVVARRDAHAVAAHHETGRGGDVGEGQRPRPVGREAKVVAPHLVHQRRSLLHSFAPPFLRSSILRSFAPPFLRSSDRSALHQDHVQVAVVVDVGERHARAHDLGQVELAGRAVVVHERQPRCLGHVVEPRTRLGSERQAGHETGHDEGEKQGTTARAAVDVNGHQGFRARRAVRSRVMAWARSVCPNLVARATASSPTRSPASTSPCRTYAADSA